MAWLHWHPWPVLLYWNNKSASDNRPGLIGSLTLCRISNPVTSAAVKLAIFSDLNVARDSFNHRTFSLLALKQFIKFRKSNLVRTYLYKHIFKTRNRFFSDIWEFVNINEIVVAQSVQNWFSCSSGEVRFMTTHWAGVVNEDYYVFGRSCSRDVPCRGSKIVNVARVSGTLPDCWHILRGPRNTCWMYF